MLDAVRKNREVYLRGLLEFGPFTWVALSLWIKQIHLAIYLQGLWVQESLGRWISAHPQVFSATIASVLFLTCLTLLVGRARRYVILAFINLVVTTVILADKISFRFYGDVISVVNLTSPKMMEAVIPSIIV